MDVQPINSATAISQPQKKKFNTVKYTGYASLALGTASIIAVSKKSFKVHKYLGYLAGAFALIHTGIIEWYHFNKKKNS